MRPLAALVAAGFATIAQPAAAAQSDTFRSDAVQATLISAQNGVAPNSATVSAGLALDLGEGWKTYWRTPGEVGLPPRIDWSGSRNVADVELLWPAPDRFTAFGIQNFGYLDEVVFPLQVTLEVPGQAAHLAAEVELLTCSQVCVPQSFMLELGLPVDPTLDAVAADRITEYSARVPTDAEAAGAHELVSAVEGDDLVISVRSETRFEAPDIFAELGPEVALAAPDIRLGDDGRLLWARIPVLSAPDGALPDGVLTVTDSGGRAFTGPTERRAEAPPAPYEARRPAPGWIDMAWIALVAFLGGAILNVMPCVLPVLTIKLNSALKAGGSDAVRVRRGFLAAAAGVMTSVWALAAIIYGLRGIGVTVGWGVQFQNPVFLAAMILLMVVFAANMMGGFEISLPSRLQTRLARAGAAGGHAGDFLTGAFAAVLATPCSAPFLGTAVAFALAGRGGDIAVVFTFLALGIAAPYLVVAAVPEMLRRLPRPGRWMVWLRAGLGLMLAVTALWLLWVMNGVGGGLAVAIVGGFSMALLVVLHARARPSARAAIATSIVSAALLAAGLTAVEDANRDAPAAGVGFEWTIFERSRIAGLVSQGEVIFVDVTADWCLTCKANKTLVLNREPVVSLLAAEGITAMQADWTRPDDRITRYLERHGRFGIPFNAVYGPGAPDGIILPEILTSKAVLRALEGASHSTGLVAEGG